MLFYTMNLIIPSVLVTLMTVLGFTLPPEAGEKITLGYAFNSFSVSDHVSLIEMRKFVCISEITILLSVCFFLTMVKDMTPPTSEAVPLLVKLQFKTYLLYTSDGNFQNFETG